MAGTCVNDPTAHPGGAVGLLATGAEPLVVCLCGPLACGKTTLAHELAAAIGRPYLSSGAARLHAAHLPATAPAREELYTYVADRDTYRELGHETAAAITRHGGAVVDATFLSADDRREFRDGLGTTRARVLFVECRAAAGVIALRMAGDGHTAPTVLALLHQLQWEPLDDVPAGDHIVIRTEGPVDWLVRELTMVIAQRAGRRSDAAAVESRAC